MVPDTTHFKVTLKLGMRQGLKGQTAGQRQGDFTDNSIKYFLYTDFVTVI
jgi:hypothetical protein